jgi:transcriptional regulator with XRE-family HTH domain
MKNNTLYEEYLKDPEFARIMSQENLIMDVTENFCEILDKEGLNRTTLAKIMGKTRGYISQLLNGGKNITLRSLADIAYALGYHVNIHFKKKAEMGEQISIDWNVGRRKTVPLNKIDMSDDYLFHESKYARLGG